MNEITSAAGSLFGEMNIVEAKSDSVIAMLPTMTDEQVKTTHCYAQEIGKAAWRVECAANAEILQRVQARAWQRNGDGVVATLASVAADLGISPQTIYRDAQIHKTFFDNKNILRTENVLQDKQFYKAALSSDNPLQTIEVLTSRKAANPFYTASDAYQDVKREKQAVRDDLLSANSPALDTLPSRYSVLYADPPWRYDFAVSSSREIENQYPTMETDDICALPVQSITETDAVLFLWATSPKLLESLRVMEAWGFTYKTCMVWVKDKIGMGYYARQRHEILLIGTQGHLPTPEPSNRPDSVIMAAREKHSAKPTQAYELLEAMYPGLLKVEVFSRCPRAGWSSWGNQAQGGDNQLQSGNDQAQGEVTE